MNKITRAIRTASDRAHSDAGLTLVEIVVAMFVLAILAISLAPLLIMGMQASVRNATLAAATQFANDRINIADSRSPVCADVVATAGTDEMIDARNVTLRATTTVGSCPAGVGTVTVSTVVIRTDTNEELATADSLVFVNS